MFRQAMSFSVNGFFDLLYDGVPKHIHQNGLAPIGWEAQGTKMGTNRSIQVAIEI